MKTMIGKVRQLSTGHFEFWCADGRVFAIEETDAPLETPLEIRLDGDSVVGWARDRSQPEAYRDETRKHIACIALIDREEQRQRVAGQVSATAKKMQDALRWNAQEQWDIQVEIAVLLVENVGDYGLTGPWNELQHRFAELHPGFEANYFHMFGPSTGRNAAGIAYVNSGTALTTNPGDDETAIHEEGHCLGLHHHRRGGEYGGSSHMGTGWGFNAPNRHYMRLIEGPEFSLTERRAYFLVPPETPEQAMAPGEGKTPGEERVVYLRGKEQTYSLELHRERVRIITNGRAKQPWAGTETVATLRPGQHTFLEGTKIEVESIHRSAACVLVAGAFSPANFPEIPLPDDAGEFQAGHWYHRAYTHQGLQTFVRGATMYGAWFTFDSTGQFFMTLKGEIRNGIAHFTLYAMDPNTRDRTVHPVGGGSLFFYDDRFGKLIYWTDLADKHWPGRGSIQLKRLLPADTHPLYGYYEFGENEGVSVHVAGGTAAAVWWTYRDDQFSTRPMWRYSQGEVREDLTIYEIDGGMANTRTDGKPTPWGVARINQNWFRWRRHGDDAFQGVPLERLI